MKYFSVIASICAILLTGCARKKVETAKDLQEVFEKPGGGVLLKTAPPEVQSMVGQAVTAMEKHDEMTAVMALRDLRASPQLNDAQVLAVEDLMKKAYENLAARADHGDQQAIATIQMLRMNPR